LNREGAKNAKEGEEKARILVSLLHSLVFFAFFAPSRFKKEFEDGDAR